MIHADEIDEVLETQICAETPEDTIRFVEVSGVCPDCLATVAAGYALSAKLSSDPDAAYVACFIRGFMVGIAMGRAQAGQP